MNSFGHFFYRESIYPEKETTTLRSTTTTSTETVINKEEREDQKEVTVRDEDVAEIKRKNSLMKEMKGFLRIVEKFTNITDLPTEPEIDIMSFRIRAVSVLKIL